MDQLWDKKRNSIMNLNYKIIETNADQHSIVVRFYTNIVTETILATDILDGIIRRCRTDYSIDLPVPTPTGTVLHDFIVSKAPINWLKIQEDVLNPSVDTSLSAVTPLVGVETGFVEPTVAAANTTIVLNQITV
jgi:hypothetical protein